MFVAAGCNKKEDEAIDEIVTVPTVAVTEFHLKADTKVMPELASVFFSIDMENGVIFNADSLPKGTDIRTLIPMISYSTTVESAVIEMSGGSKREGVSDYKKNPNDSIDFTGRVTLTLTAQGSLSRTYLLKVNVHKTAPDSLMWDDMAVRTLPGHGREARRQKTVELDGTFYSMTEGADGNATVSSTDNLFDYVWTSRQTSLPAGSRIETLSAAGGHLYILAADGHLMKASASAGNVGAWEDTGEVWTSMTGSFGNHVLGTGLSNGTPVHTHYPADGSLAVTPLEAGFPIEGQTAMRTVSSPWSGSPVGFVFGGVTADGTVTDAVWAFDGDGWANINIGGIPPMSGATMAGYYYYRKTSGTSVKTEFPVWIVFGGRLADGTLNRTVYLSYDNGVNWKRGDQLVQLPDFIPALYGCDCLTASHPMEGNLADGWTKMPARKGAMKRIVYDIDGYEIRWECPYLFIFGGYGADGALNTSVWRGVLSRLQSMPLI